MFVLSFSLTYGIEELQADLGEWLVYYSSDRPYQGLRNMGRMPAGQTISLVQETIKEEYKEYSLGVSQ